MKNEGSKKARAELKAFHYCLNSPSLLPSQVYTPSQIGSYPVLWINQIVALMFSHNYDRVPFCINRAYSSFNHFAGKPVFDLYSSVAKDYLCQVAYFLKNFTDLDAEYLHRTIPQEIYECGPKSAPEYIVQDQIFNK